MANALAKVKTDRRTYREYGTKAWMGLEMGDLPRNY